MRGRLCPSWSMIFISWLQLPRQMCFIEMDWELDYIYAHFSVYNLPFARTEPFTHEYLHTHVSLIRPASIHVASRTPRSSWAVVESSRTATVGGHRWRTCQWARRLALSLVRLGRGQVERNRCERREGPAWLWPWSWASCDHRCVCAFQGVWKQACLNVNVRYYTVLI